MCVCVSMCASGEIGIYRMAKGGEAGGFGGKATLRVVFRHCVASIEPPHMWSAHVLRP